MGREPIRDSSLKIRARLDVLEPSDVHCALLGRLNLLLSFISTAGVLHDRSVSALPAENYYILTSDQTRLPAEFKHINKRRKRN